MGILKLSINQHVNVFGGGSTFPDEVTPEQSRLVRDHIVSQNEEILFDIKDIIFRSLRSRSTRTFILE